MLELDLLVAARTAPAQSYANMAERRLSLLNLALQNCTFARSEMPEAYEKKMKKLIIHEVCKGSSRKRSFHKGDI